MRLETIPEEKFAEYRLRCIFDGYKWDPQFLDNGTISRHVLILTRAEANELESLTEKLAGETVFAENLINKKLGLSRPLKLPCQTRHQLKKMSNYEADKHVRLMRFDFHPVTGGGFALSEVNSDVPGGFAESSLIPSFAASLLESTHQSQRQPRYRFVNFGEILTKAIAAKVKSGGTIAFVHCTSYSDDRQMVQFLGDRLLAMGFSSIYCAADHIKFKNKKAFCILDSNETAIDGIFRFTPIEWCVGLKRTWHGYFDTTTPSCNHPIAVFAQTKRFPLIWDELEKNGADLSTWRRLLPKTLPAKKAPKDSGFIFKPVSGRVGEGISIKEACVEGEYKKILKSVALRPSKFVAQRMFESRPLVSNEGKSFHVCIGAYSVEGKCAGFYARISSKPRIDSYAADIAVLVEEDS